MKIAYFITGLGLGGAEVVTIELANLMARRGHSVTFIYLNGENMHTDRIDPRIRTYQLNMRKTPVGLCRSLSKARHILREFRPDVVHGHMFHANLFIRLLRMICPIPRLICTEHSTDIESRMRMYLYRITDYLSDVNTNVSEEATRQFIEQKAFGRQKSLTVFNGIDLIAYHQQEDPGSRATLRKQYGIADNDFVFLHVGRFHPAKDHRNLLEAFARITKQVPSAKLLIVGDGELRSEIETQIEVLSLQERVVLAGVQRNVADYYHAADCFVLSSAWEGLPMVLLEALAYGLPAVCTNVSDCAKILPADAIVPVRDSIKLAAKMLSLSRMTPVELTISGQYNRRLAERFDLNAIGTIWINLYQKDLHR